MHVSDTPRLGLTCLGAYTINYYFNHNHWLIKFTSTNQSLTMSQSESTNHEDALKPTNGCLITGLPAMRL